MRGRVSLVRCIFAIPELNSSEQVEALRSLFDPLYGKVPAHITLVFPFDLLLDNASITLHMQQVLAECPRLQVTFDACRIGLSGYAFLPVLCGATELRRLYNRLNAGPLHDARAQQRFSGKFRPHLTIGRIATPEEAFAVGRMAAGVQRNLHGTITSVWLETILPHNEARVEHVLQVGNQRLQ